MNDLDQYFTPFWFAESIVERYFPRLDATDVCIEPSCGEGSFLRAIPAPVRAVGVEIDARVAEIARRETRREVICGDFRTVPLTIEPTFIIGNPPFDADVFDGFLDRAHALLPEGARAGFLLPTYFMQTASRVTRYMERWSMSIDLVPRNAFSGRMRTPLMFAVFSKDAKRTLIGLAFYEEADALRKMAEPYKAMLSEQSGSAWRAVCELALKRLGGEATLTQIYHELKFNRPTRNRWWRQKIRQTLRHYTDFIAVETGRYRLSTQQELFA